MTSSIKIAPPNSVVLVSDMVGGEPPETMGGKLIATTGSCIAIGSLSEVDGETTITLGPVHDVDPGRPASFIGKLKTPNKEVRVKSVLGQILLKLSGAGQESLIKVWVNDAKEPDEIIIGVSSKDDV